ncbi:hypothetical protein EVAR_3180_1 [Eumeta japonica]|uniref:Uncharacterized protein n=1 Tax=Eumeta variegata TaxID=151549 RepID=A0A4C1XGC8_EUMVA|nr:hypothetical protein EVAR_3180_1 [Eumeta japonica]
MSQTRSHSVGPFKRYSFDTRRTRKAFRNSKHRRRPKKPRYSKYPYDGEDNSSTDFTKIFNIPEGKLTVSLVSLTYAQRVHRGRRSSYPLRTSSCKVLDLFAEDRRKPNTITMRRRKKSTYCSARLILLQPQFQNDQPAGEAARRRYFQPRLDEFKTSSTSKETSIFEIPIRRGEDNSSTDFTKIFNILEGKLTGENRTRLRCDGVKRRARIAAHGRYFLTKRTIGKTAGSGRRSEKSSLSAFTAAGRRSSYPLRTSSVAKFSIYLRRTGENRTRLRCDGVKRRARIAAHGRYFLTKRTIGTADGRQWPAFREIFAQEFKTSSTSKETSIFEIPIRRGEDNSSTDFTKIFNILEGKLTGENRTRLRCDGVKRRARIAAHGRYFLTKRTIGTADGRQWPAFREIFAQPKRGRVRHDTRRSLKIIVSLVSLTYAQRVHRGRTTIFLPSEDIECCKVLDLFAEDRLTRRRRTVGTFSLNERSVQLTAGSGRRSEKSSLRCENNGDMRRPASGAAAG